MSDKLRVAEIFVSLQGESTYTGLRTVFVRLQGCSLKCTFCDTFYAQDFESDKSQLLTIGEIVQIVKQFGTKYVLLTGGEPLEHANAKDLLVALCEEGFTVSLETNGEEDISGIDGRVKIVMDIKLPGSGVSARKFIDNVRELKAKDEIKMVISSKQDYEFAKIILGKEIKENFVGEVLFSPGSKGKNFDFQMAKDIWNWILEDNLNVRLNLQIHKILFNDLKGI